MAIELTGQFKAFVDFTKSAEGLRDDALVAIGGQKTESGVKGGFLLGSNGVRNVSASKADSKLGLFHWWRSNDQKAANIEAHRLFYSSVEDIFKKIGKPIPDSVLKELGSSKFRESGSPLSARRIRAVTTAIEVESYLKDHEIKEKFQPIYNAISTGMRQLKMDERLDFRKNVFDDHFAEFKRIDREYDAEYGKDAVECEKLNKELTKITYLKKQAKKVVDAIKNGKETGNLDVANANLKKLEDEEKQFDEKTGRNNLILNVRSGSREKANQLKKANSALMAEPETKKLRGFIEKLANHVITIVGEFKRLGLQYLAEDNTKICKFAIQAFLKANPSVAANLKKNVSMEILGTMHDFYKDERMNLEENDLSKQTLYTYCQYVSSALKGVVEEVEKLKG